MQELLRNEKIKKQLKDEQINKIYDQHRDAKVMSDVKTDPRN